MQDFLYEISMSCIYMGSDQHVPTNQLCRYIVYGCQEYISYKTKTTYQIVLLGDEVQATCLYMAKIKCSGELNS